MKHYTDTIPPSLAWKIKEKGMTIWTEGHSIWCPSYAEVFDWLMNEGVYCTVTDTRAAPTYEIVGYINIVCILKKRSKVSEVLRTCRDFPHIEILEYSERKNGYWNTKGSFFAEPEASQYFTHWMEIPELPKED